MVKHRERHEYRELLYILWIVFVKELQIVYVENGTMALELKAAVAVAPGEHF